MALLGWPRAWPWSASAARGAGARCRRVLLSRQSTLLRELVLDLPQQRCTRPDNPVCSLRCDPPPRRNLTASAPSVHTPTELCKSTTSICTVNSDQSFVKRLNGNRNTGSFASLARGEHLARRPAPAGPAQRAEPQAACHLPDCDTHARSVPRPWNGDSTRPRPAAAHRARAPGCWAGATLSV